MLVSRKLGTKQYIVLCYLIGQVSIFAWLYPPPHRAAADYMEILDLWVLSALTVGIVYEWFTVLNRMTIRQAVLCMLSIVVLVVELFALAYYIVYCRDGAAFTIFGGQESSTELFHHGYEFLYYSVTTFTGTGYGDVTPVSSTAKEIASIEMLAGWIISTLMMALLGSKISVFFFHKRHDI